MRRLLGIVFLFLFIVIIYLKEDAQVGIFENTPTIEMKSNSHISAHTAWITITYEGKTVDIPYDSIAYFVERKNIERKEKELITKKGIERKEKELVKK